MSLMLQKAFKNCCFQQQSIFATQVAFFTTKSSRRKNKVNYPCVPEWQRSQVRDPFDYQLRTPEQVAEQHKYFAPDFNIQANYKRYTAGDVRIDNEDNLDTREAVAKFVLDMRELKLAPLQRERFIFLLGRRYNPQKPHYVKIVVKQYNTFSENYVRAAETLREIYWEALRAPDTDVISERNPYRGEFIKKKLLGKTKEERQAKKKQFAIEMKDHMEQVDRQEIENQTKEAAKDMSLRAKRRAQAAKRAKLGFMEAEENVEDPIMDKMDRDDALYQKTLQEKSTRKPVTLVTEVQGISKKEQSDTLLRSDEMFNEVK